MNELQDLRQRLMALESHSAHQDGTIEDLHQMVNKQWLEIETLQQNIAQLGGRLSRLEGDIETARSGDQPPPHY